MEKEPYNIARELLEKYDPTHPSLVPATPQPAAPRPASQSAGAVYNHIQSYAQSRRWSFLTQSATGDQLQPLPQSILPTTLLEALGSLQSLGDPGHLFILLYHTLRDPLQGGQPDIPMSSFPRVS